jgi:hypothetical protein
MSGISDSFVPHQSHFGGRLELSVLQDMMCMVSA